MVGAAECFIVEVRPGFMQSDAVAAHSIQQVHH
jgi:hypothetical protein